MIEKGESDNGNLKEIFQKYYKVRRKHLVFPCGGRLKLPVRVYGTRIILCMSKIYVTKIYKHLRGGLQH